MSLDIYLRLRAAQAGRAQPRASRRHVHLAARPMVVVGAHLAGDPAAVVALRYGTLPDWSQTVVIPEPRDRGLRSERLADFARDLLRYVGRFTSRVAVERRVRGTVETEVLCTDAPQLVCPDRATAAWLTGMLGWSVHHLPAAGEDADPALARAGAHLSFFAGLRQLPGSSAVLVATDLLTTHWVTGQSPAEDADLGSVLASVAPPGGQHARDTTVATGRLPAAGPVPDPGWERDVLQPLLGEYGRTRQDGQPDCTRQHGQPDCTRQYGQPDRAAAMEIVAACTGALAPAWRDTWTALELVGQLPEAAHVPERRSDDRAAWTRHCDRVEADPAYARPRPDQPTPRSPHQRGHVRAALAARGAPAGCRAGSSR